MSGVVARTFLPSEDLQPLLVSRSMPTYSGQGPSTPGAPPFSPGASGAPSWIDQETIPGMKNSTLLILAATLGLGLFLMTRKPKQVLG